MVVKVINATFTRFYVILSKSDSVKPYSRLIEIYEVLWNHQAVTNQKSSINYQM